MPLDEYLICLNKLLLESPLPVSSLDDDGNDNESNNEDDEAERDNDHDENDVPAIPTSITPKLFRPIDALGRITLPLTARSRFRCAWCDIWLVASPSGGASSSSSSDGRSSHPVPWKECSKCHSAMYCSPLCLDQDKKIGNHRSLCAQICRHKKRVSNLGLEYRESNNGVMDVFDWSNGMVFHFADPHRGLGTVGEQYLMERKALVDSLVNEGASKMIDIAVDAGTDAGAVSSAFTDTIPPPHWNRMALDLSLEHSLDILYLDPVVNCCNENNNDTNCIRTGIAHSLLVLERFQDLYDYVKYWNVLPHKLRQMHRRPMEEPDVERTTISPRVYDMLHVALGPKTFMKTRRQYFFEDQRELVLRLPSRPSSIGSDSIRTFPGPSMTEIVCVLYVALAKLLVLEKVKNVRRVVQHCIPIEAEMITATIGSYLDLASDWMTSNTLTVLKQCRELLAFAENSIPGTLRTLCERPPSPVDEIESPRHLNATETSPTSMELLRLTWFHHKLPWTFLVNFFELEQEDACRTNIPRNDAIQQALDHTYSSYIDLHTSDTEYLECRRHWERVKSTEAVRTLLTDEVENGRHLCGSGFYPTQMYLRLVNQDTLNTTDNFELLFGTRNVPYSVMRDVDIYLANEHLCQVKYLPEVLSFCKTHDFVIPDEACTCLQTLCEKGLATPVNTTLLFGDDDRLGAWFLHLGGTR